MKFNKIAIIGVGLIGGSIGKTILKKKAADEVIGVCRREASLQKALKEKSITTGFVNNYGEALKGAELIIIGTPVETIKEVMKNIALCIKDKNVLVTDVGSTKEEIVKFSGSFKENFTFIGSHPLAGSEKTGVEASSDNLLEGSICVVTPETGTGSDMQIKNLETFWKTLGADVRFYSPEDHDRIIAFSSHLPHFVAYALAGTLKEDFDKNMFSTGFKDTTRIASSDPDLWSDIFMTNRDNLIKALEEFKEILSGMQEQIKENRYDELKSKLEDLKRKRDEYFQ